MLSKFFFPLLSVNCLIVINDISLDFFFLGDNLSQRYRPVPQSEEGRALSLLECKRSFNIFVFSPDNAYLILLQQICSVYLENKFIHSVKAVEQLTLNRGGIGDQDKCTRVKLA